MKKILALILTLALTLSLCACGGSERKEQAAEIYNALVDVYNETADLMNANADAIPQELFDIFNETFADMETIRTHLDSDEVLDEEVYEQLIADLQASLSNCQDLKAELEAALAG